ncbi:LysR family transcriptional regulator [Escherichia sp. E10V10]|uniref:DNA-binding transcriptional repressor CitR n=1 Tax=unclassified Escherichia TaxID=2608889 RepID=UPI0010294ECB|nr:MULTISPECIES: LysR family transcriptional regulator [unclassified Escherichia]RZM91828.1 LysR family transcriptional regulator [Escherichia sp. E14V5]RZN00913.1 LysR family transcriptional regulator [Escherichia sp. E14V7]RZN25150.1 LysR family transcriptional regulator [Escherichia sp. E14V10]RZN50335.1 LysR family transcriptional regulator [Escherichia sp. E10V10]TGB54051.1 LysR family transcriptional regulator [Escherichia sp. E5028]
MANLYDLKKFDLNLLVIFECIYQHLSISKAAESLYITPSAVSQSLQRLRTQFNDPLFTRAGKGITPTTTGLNLHHHLEKNLRNLEQTINIVNKSELKKKFIIYGPQFISATNSSLLINSLRQDAVIDIEHHDIMMAVESAEDLLAYRKADLVVTLAPVISRSVSCIPFQSIRNTLICSTTHPRINERSTHAQILDEEFTFLISKIPGLEDFQMEIEALMANRKISFRSSSLFTIINTIAVTDLIGIVPYELYRSYHKTLQLKQIKLEHPLPSNTLYMSYNKSSLNNLTFSRFIDRLNDNL